MDREGGKDFSFYPKRFLVEECQSIHIGDVKNRLRQRDLHYFAERLKPIHIRQGEQVFEVCLCLEPMQLAWKSGTTSEAFRFWFLCQCGRRVRRLFFNPRSLDAQPGLACQKCHGLDYLSQRSGNRRWYREIVKPLRRLIRREAKLSNLRPTQKHRCELHFVQDQTLILIGRARRSQASTSKGRKRRYKDIDLVMGQY
jgi:hypothetical protein